MVWTYTATMNALQTKKKNIIINILQQCDNIVYYNDHILQFDITCSAGVFIGGRMMVYLVRVFSRHLVFTKRGELSVANPPKCFLIQDGGF